MDLSNINVQLFVDNKIEEASQYLNIDYVLNKDLTAEEKVGFLRGVSEAFAVLRSAAAGELIDS